MLFNSYLFILVFLPLTFWGFFALGRVQKSLAITWLIMASLFFYAWWSPKYLFLILGSMVVNYWVGHRIQHQTAKSQKAKTWLMGGIVFNLALIVFYKYTNLIISAINWSCQQAYPELEIALPLAISFFTFQQIAYLVDIYQNKTQTAAWLQYLLFITFFPQLIAGPIVHHREMIGQFKQDKFFHLKTKNVAIGLTIFFIGLFKKVGIADQIAPIANNVFHLAQMKEFPTFWEAWGGALTYTFQLYFDFSGYSDMAIGLARLFNISLPTNFNSPYRAANIIDFWRRWHITLSTFLRDYLYIPLGGNKNGFFKRHQNLMITMLLGGLWHGAHVNFLLWGGLHGIYLIINHLWQQMALRQKLTHLLAYKLSSRLLTFIAVVVAWVLFRAPSIDCAMRMYQAMLGWNGIELPQRFAAYADQFNFVNFTGMFYHQLFHGPKIYALLVALGGIVWLLPNTLTLLKKYSPALGFKPSQDLIFTHIQWRPTWAWAVFLAMLSIICLTFLSQPSEFLYYQF